MQKNRKRILLFILLFVALLSVGLSSAFIIKDATSSGNKGETLESAIILKWGEGSVLGDIDNLAPGNPAYREVVLAAPVKSANATGGVFHMTLAASTEDVSGDKYGNVDGDDVIASYSAVGIVIEYRVGSAFPQTNDGLTYTYSGDPEIAITVATTVYLRISITQGAYDAYVNADEKIANNVSGTYSVLGAVITLGYHAD